MEKKVGTGRGIGEEDRVSGHSYNSFIHLVKKCQKSFCLMVYIPCEMKGNNISLGGHRKKGDRDSRYGK